MEGSKALFKKPPQGPALHRRGAHLKQKANNSPMHNRRFHRKKYSWLSWALSIGIPIIVILLLRIFVFGIYVVPSGSMQNTLLIGDHILTLKLDGKWTPLRRGDVIVFKDPGHWLTAAQDDAMGGGFLVKRLIGLPGDTVACCTSQGLVTINGVPINEESYLYPGNPPSLIKFDVKVTPGHIFVMGDHRNISADSRYHLNEDDGLVPISDVVGVVKFVWWPIDRWRYIGDPSSVYRNVGGVSGAYE